MGRLASAFVIAVSTFVIFVGAVCAQTPSIQFAKNYGTAASNTIVLATAVDSAGNSYIAGYFDGAALVMGGTTLTRIGTQDAFAAKLDSSGNVVWAQNFGGAGASAQLQGIVVDGAATPNVYLAGNFSGANLTTPALTLIGTGDALVIKMSGTGGSTPIWAQNFGGAGAQAQFNGIAVDNAATPNVYLAGIFDVANLTTPALTRIGGPDALVMKLPGTGGSTPIWAQNFGGAGASAYFQGIAVDSAATPNIYLVGYFVAANLTTPNLSKLNAGDVNDSFIFKMPGTGGSTPTWIKSFGGIGASVNLSGIAVDNAPTANVYVTGYFQGANLTTPSLTKIGTFDGLVIKMPGTGGTPSWAQNFGGPGTKVQMYGIAVDTAATPNVYLAGYFYTGNLTTPALTRIGNVDGLVIKMPGTGGSTPIWANNFAGAGANLTFYLGRDIAVDAAATPNVYLGGYFVAANLTTPALTKIGTTDALVIKYGSPSAPGAPTSVSATAGSGQATISFAAPISGGAAITGYTVTSSPGNITATGSTSPITVTGLTGGTAYSFTVAATNSLGTGPASAASNSVTPTGSSTTTSTPPAQTPPSWVNPATSVVTPPAITLTPPVTSSTTPPSAGRTPSTGSFALPTGLFTRSDLTFTLRVATSLGGTVTSTPGANGSITASVALGGTNVQISFTPAAMTFTFSAAPSLRPGARLTQVKSNTAPTATSAAAALTPLAASIPSPILVTGPSVSVPSTTVSLNATAPDGSNYTLAVPITLTVPGETTTVTAASVDNGGNFGTTASTSPALSRDGQIVSFTTTAGNLALGISGATSQVMRYAVPVGSVDLASQSNFIGQLGGAAAYGSSLSPAISADGRWLAFASDATNIYYSSPAASARQVYLMPANQPYVALASRVAQPALLNANGGFYPAASDRPSLSSDGTWLAFESDVTNLVSGVPSGVRQIYVQNTATGTVTLVSATAAGAPGNAASTRASISDDSTTVLFESDATNFGASGHQIWVKTLATGALALVSASNANAPGNGTSTNASLSADGRFVAFESDATNLVSNASVTSRQVYRRSILAGTTNLVSVAPDGATPANASSNGASISGDGRFVVFKSAAANLVSGPAPKNTQIYVRDAFAGTTLLVSNDASGNLGNGDSDTPVISGNGRIIAFTSLANNLDGTQTNGVSQVYIAGNPMTSPVATGWWWNPSQPGQGFSIEERGNALFLGDYFYANDNTPLWLAASDANAGASSFSGQTSQYANGSTLFGAYQSPRAAMTLGTSALALSNSSNAAFTLSGNSQPVQRFEFVTGGVAAGPVAGYPETGWWWNPATPGQGLFLEVQGTTLFASLYAYDGRGQASWYIAQAPMSSPTAFNAALMQCQGASASAPGGSAPNCTTSVGSLGLSFSSTLSGSLTLTNSPAKPVTYPIQRFRF